VLHEIDFLFEKFAIDPCLSYVWRVVTWIQTCASLNHREKMKAKPSRLIPRKPTENLKLVTVIFFLIIQHFQKSC